jgi:phage terminase large subunit GpA-like protein
VHFPAGFDEIWFSELTAEVLKAGKWVKMRPRNETLDLIVYAAAAIMRPPYAQTRSDMDWVPVEFRAPEVIPRLGSPPARPAAGAAVVNFPSPSPPPTAPRRVSMPVNRFTGRKSGSYMKGSA